VVELVDGGARLGDGGGAALVREAVAPGDLGVARGAPLGDDGGLLLRGRVRGLAEGGGGPAGDGAARGLVLGPSADGGVSGEGGRTALLSRSGKDDSKSSASAEASAMWYSPEPPSRSSSASSTVVTLRSFGVANRSASAPRSARSRSRKLEASPLAGRSLTLVWPGRWGVSAPETETARDTYRRRTRREMGSGPPCWLRFRSSRGWVRGLERWWLQFLQSRG
jgi:hypothetical protein